MMNRPQVISPTTMERLDQYRGFRNVVRNVYTFVLDPIPVGLLVDDLEDTFTRLEKESELFLEFLEGCSTSML
jgi:uncharacterized protein YutE (UPF0331/DUF86 family)